MSNSRERQERFARSNEAANATIEQERAAREAKTARLRAIRIEQEAKGRPPVGEARRRKPGS
jgi:hypothetical protein